MKRGERIYSIQAMIDAVLIDDEEAFIAILSERFESVNERRVCSYLISLPGILSGGPPLAAYPIFFGAIKCFRFLVRMSFDHTAKDTLGRSMSHFAACCDNMDVCRELSDLGFITEIEIPASVRKIGNNCFVHCDALKSCLKKFSALSISYHFHCKISRYEFKRTPVIMTDEQRQFDLAVVRELRDTGALNQVQATITADIAQAINESQEDLASVKPFRSFKSTIDYRLANSFVFQYLEKHGMTETIRCINAETDGKLKSAEPGESERELKIKDSEDKIYELRARWKPKIATRSRLELTKQIAKRYKKIGYKQVSTPIRLEEDNSLVDSFFSALDKSSAGLLKPVDSESWLALDDVAYDSLKKNRNTLTPKTPADFQ